MGMGAQSLYMVLVGSLDLGHDFYSADSESDFFDRVGTSGPARVAGLDSFWKLMGDRGAGESFDACVFAILWFVDMAAAI